MSSKVFRRKIFQAPGYRIFLGILGMGCLISFYFKHLFVFVLMVGVWAMPLLLPFRIQEIYALDFWALNNLLSALVLVLFCYCWRKRHHGWWVEVLCVLTFYAAIGLGTMGIGPA
jgi:hypothetical protein